MSHPFPTPTIFLADALRQQRVKLPNVDALNKTPTQCSPPLPPLSLQVSVEFGCKGLASKGKLPIARSAPPAIAHQDAPTNKAERYADDRAKPKHLCPTYGTNKLNTPKGNEAHRAVKHGERQRRRSTEKENARDQISAKTNPTSYQQPSTRRGLSFEEHAREQNGVSRKPPKTATTSTARRSNPFRKQLTRPRDEVL